MSTSSSFWDDPDRAIRLIKVLISLGGWIWLWFLLPWQVVVALTLTLSMYENSNR